MYFAPPQIFKPGYGPGNVRVVR